MPDPDSFYVPSHPFSSLNQNPLLSELLSEEYSYDPDAVSALIEPLLNASERCQQAEFYIQAVATQRVGFLITNLSQDQPVKVTPISSAWLVGRSTGCIIQLRHRTISRRHAVIGRYSFGFYIADLGSLNGTWVNQQRLEPARRIVLEDGDVIQFGTMKAEFFLAQPDLALRGSDETDGQSPPKANPCGYDRADV